MSGIDPKLRRLNDFAQAERALPQLEQNVADALARVAEQAQPHLTPTNLKTSAYVAGLDETVVARGTFIVTLPIAAAQNAGRCVAVELQSGTVTVVTASGQVQGAASDALSTAGLYCYVSDGVGWWRPPIGAGGAAVNPAVTVTDETTYGIAPAVGVDVLYARNDHTHGSPATPVTSIAASDATLVFSAATGAVTAHVGVISDANVDSTIATEDDLATLETEADRQLEQLQHIRILLIQLIRLEMGGELLSGVEGL